MANICSTVKRTVAAFVTGTCRFEPSLQLLGGSVDTDTEQLISKPVRQSSGITCVFKSCQTVMREKHNPLVGVRWELSCIFVVCQCEGLGLYVS